MPLPQANGANDLPAELFRKAFFASPVSLGVCSADEGRFLEVNDSFLALTGFSREELLGHTDAELGLWADAQARAEALSQLASTGAVSHLESRIRTRDGQVREVLVSLQPVNSSATSYLLLVTQDITERLQRETAQRHADKMEAVGQLAAGFAHDFNNILTVVQGHASLLLLDSKFGGPANKSLQQVSLAAERAAALTRQLLTFGRKQAMRPRRLEVNGLIREMAERLRGLLGERIGLRLELSEQPRVIHADAGMMEQVFLNLAMNARDAMPQGGQFTLQTTTVALDPAAARAHTEARSGLFLCVTATDNGCGITPAMLSRIFEPFFTTKDVGKGPGLGLATLYGIVKQHNGWTEVASQLEHGTTFRIFLPIQEAATPDSQPGGERLTASSEPKRILVVEDESPLRALVQSILERQGYRVIDACNGVDALRVWEQHRGEFDLLLTDMVMPEGLSGRELASKLRAQKPGLKVIYSSGYTPDLLGPGMEGLRDGVNYLQKPYRPHLLAQTVRACLENSGSDKN